MSAEVVIASLCLCHTHAHTYKQSEKEPNIKNIHIKQTSDVSSATVDDIKASVMTLRLGSPSPSSGMIRKATSSQSLNSKRERGGHFRAVVPTNCRYCFSGQS